MLIHYTNLHLDVVPGNTACNAYALLAKVSISELT